VAEEIYKEDEKNMLINIYEHIWKKMDRLVNYFILEMESYV
jgi:hypothetical protein